jgi:hypothetical protein
MVCASGGMGKLGNTYVPRSTTHEVVVKSDEMGGADPDTLQVNGGVDEPGNCTRTFTNGRMDSFTKMGVGWVVSIVR